MGQADILDLLSEDKNQWFSVEQLAEKLNVNRSSINMCCLKLRKQDLVNTKKGKHMKHKVTGNEFKIRHIFFYKHKE